MPATLWLGERMVREEQGTVRGEIWQQRLDLSSVSGIVLSVCNCLHAGAFRATGMPQTADAVEADFECLMSHWSVISMFTLFLAEIE